MVVDLRTGLGVQSTFSNHLQADFTISILLIRSVYYWYYYPVIIKVSYSYAICCAGTHIGTHPNCQRKSSDLGPILKHYYK